MGNSLVGLAHVDGGEVVVAEIQVIDAVRDLAGTRGDGVSMQCLGYLHGVSLEGDQAITQDGQYGVVGSVVDGRQHVRKGTWARSITSTGHCQTDRFMGWHLVVDRAPGIEVAL